MSPNILMCLNDFYGKSRIRHTQTYLIKLLRTKQIRFLEMKLGF